MINSNHPIIDHLTKYLGFLFAMTAKEIKGRYKRALLGFLWMVINPILQMLVMVLVLSYFIDIENYHLFTFSGLLPWNAFATSFKKATSSFVDQRTLLKKAKFNKEIIPISIILSNLFHLCIASLILIIMLAMMGKITVWILLIIPALIWLTALTIGLSLITSTFNVYFRDINFFVNAIVRLWFYCTPILYQINFLPKKFEPLFAINPMTSIVELFHLATANQGLLNKQIVLGNAIVTLILLYLGVIIYRKKHQNFVDWL